MGVKTHYANKAAFYFKGESKVTNLIDFCSNLKMPMTTGAVNPKYPMNQKILNAMIRHGLVSIGWDIKDTRIVPKKRGTNLDQKGDFTTSLNNGIKVFGEVEFGNIASAWRDLFKFNLVIAFDTYDAGIFILPCDSIAPEIEGCYSFEKVKNIVTAASSSVNCPLLIIGIEPDRSLDINTNQLEPNWIKSDWRKQSETLWDDFVTKYSATLF
ncbi:MAG TPA: hypothetical protein EYQ58_08050 [Candidatus Poseidoniales archaeon]|nr:hypothetical protein [Candidatus Poseidoniales archaeon]